MLRLVMMSAILFLAPRALAAEYSQLVEKTGYSPVEKKQLSEICRETEGMKLPVDIISNKIREADVKKVRYEALVPVLRRKLSKMKEADDIIAKSGVAVRNRRYAIQVLMGDLEKNIKIVPCEMLLAAVVKKGLVFDDAAKYFDSLGNYHSENIADEAYAEILAACVSKGIQPDRGEKILYVFTEAVRNNLSVDVAKELVLGGVSENMRSEDIGANLQAKQPSRRSVSDDSRKDTRGRGQTNDRGGPENGAWGDNTRHGR